ncbi:MAG TPA: hypothetical protein VD970_14255, partial [Acetobacteraceae bacterium]|nr:hypothetical protein [Acetobacteraceae bacterium]
MRVGSHDAHGRVVFDWAERVPYVVERDGDRVRLRFGNGVVPDLAGARRPPRNVLAIAAEGETVTVTLAPGARSRVFVLGNRVVLDAADPQEAGSPLPAAAPAAAPDPASRQARREARRPARPTPPAAAAAPLSPEAAPAALAAAPLPPAPASHGVPPESGRAPEAPVPQGVAGAPPQPSPSAALPAPPVA